MTLPAQAILSAERTTRRVWVELQALARTSLSRNGPRGLARQSFMRVSSMRARREAIVPNRDAMARRGWGLVCNWL